MKRPYATLHSSVLKFSLAFSLIGLVLLSACQTQSQPADSSNPAPNPETSDIPDDAIYIATKTALDSALLDAEGGEYFVLRDGIYGSLRISKQFPSNVVIKAENNLKAVFENLDLEESSHVMIDGFLINEGIAGSKSSHTVIRNSKLSDAVFKFATQITFHNNDLTYANFNDSTYFEITQNYIHHASADLLHIKGNAHHFLVENNILYDTIPDAAAHSDALQMAGNTNGNPHDFILRGNYLYDDPTTDVAGGKTKKLQGFFLADAKDKGYYNVLIENNIINVSNTSNSIAVLGASENVTIRNNTLLPTSVESGGGIRLTLFSGATGDEILVTKNVASLPKYGGVAGIMATDNIFYTQNNIDLASLFKDPKAFGTWKIFIPKPESSIDFGSGYGAEQRVMQMLKGENVHASQEN